jgi:organic radical activating enzyme
VVRQLGIEPEMFNQLDFKHFYLQPMDGPDLKAHTDWATEYCLKHPQWKLSIQTHKLLGIR